MQIDIDHYIGRHPDPKIREESSGQQSGIIRMYGINEAKNSVLAHVHNFEPYFYVEAPDALTSGVNTTKDILERMRGLLNVWECV